MVARIVRRRDQSQDNGPRARNEKLFSLIDSVDNAKGVGESFAVPSKSVLSKVFDSRRRASTIASLPQHRGSNVSIWSAVFLVLGVSVVSTSPALALAATTTSVSASPSPAIAGQSVTLTALTNAPGTVAFTYNGQTVGTSTTSPAGAAVPATQTWSFTGNSAPTRLATDSNNNIYISTWNPSDCGGGRCQTKQLTPGGAVNYAPSESWNGTYNQVTGLAVASDGTIYEAVYGGAATNTIRKRTSIGATSSVLVPSSAGISRPTGMTLDSSDNLYVTSSLNGTIFKITPAGVVSTYASGLGNAISGPVMNKTTGVLYFINGSQDIMQIPAGGGTATLLAVADCHVDPTTGDSYGGELAIDPSGNIYGGLCGGLSPSGPPNRQPVSQINPSTGAMREFLSWPTCMNGSLPNWAAGCNGYAIAFMGNKLVTAGANMDQSNVMVLGPSGYIASITITPSTPGSFSTGASLAPSDAVTYSASNGSDTLSVRPAAPSMPDLAESSDLGSSSTDNLTRDNTPRIEVPGTYESGDTITVTATKSGSANVTCTYVIPATGCDLGTLADGTWSITATDTHPTGGTSSVSTALSISVDSSAPSAPSGLGLATASDSGSSNTDNVTADNTPTMSASGGNAGDTVTITAAKSGSADVTCTYTLPGGGCDLGTLADGTWSITAKFTDPAGNTSNASSPLPVSIDSSGPAGLTPDLAAASDSGASSSDNITSDATPTISLPGQSTGDVVTVTARKAGSSDVVCSYTVGASTGCDLGALADGTWDISASVVDRAGNTGTTQSLEIAIDSTSSSAPSGLDLATPSDLGSSSTDDITSDSTPTVSAVGGVAGDTVTITAAKSGSANVTCSYVVPATGCDLGSLADGVWNVNATITDAAGNVSSPSTSLPITIDSSAPAAPGTPDLASASDSGSSSTDDLTNDNTPRIEVPGGGTGDTITVTATPTGGGAPITCTFIVGQATSCELGPLPDGRWSITATSTDQAGNVSAPTSALSIDIDASAPSAPTDVDLVPGSDSGSSNTDNITNDDTPTVGVTGGAPGDTVTISATRGATTVSCTFVVGVSSECTLPPLSDGTWDVTSTLTDASGNVSSASASLPIVIAASLPTRATPDMFATSDSGPSNSDDITNDVTPEITIPDASAGDVVTVTATDGSNTLSCTYTVGVVTSCVLPTLGDGVWTVSASLVDIAGNIGSSSGSLSIRIDATAPSSLSAVDLLEASDTGSLNSDNVTSDVTPTFGISGGSTGDTVTVTASNGTASMSCTFLVGAATSCDLPTMSYGTWIVTARLMDSAGNMSANSGTLMVKMQSRSGRLPTTGIRYMPDLVALWLATVGIGILAVRQNRRSRCTG
jgi:hypothetical protein